MLQIRIQLANDKTEAWPVKLHRGKRCKRSQQSIEYRHYKEIQVIYTLILVRYWLPCISNYQYLA